ncbi:hypothetical protein [Aggregatilinea lenta]|uniref:hypothetical protein n=1 Tax=Aggregatilinea lenta TaxID=913108 RepID=UPI0013C349CC|nr:hypothetical protein [Aggregatilinea lenta]
MIRYVFQALSFEPLTPDVIREIVQLPAIATLIFPAAIPNFPDQEDIRLSSPREFELSIVPEFYQTDMDCRVSLLSGQGVKLSSTIKTDHKIMPSNTLLEFNSEHLHSSTVDLSLLKMLITEIVPVFRPGKVTVYAWPKKLSELQSGSAIGPNGDYYPIRMGWLSYFGEVLVDRLGVESFRTLEVCDEIIPIHNGLLVVLTSDPFNPDDENHRAREEAAIEHLGLRRLLGKPKPW